MNRDQNQRTLEPTNNVLSLVRAARNSADRSAGLCLDHLIPELVTLHREMIEQLQLERLAANGAAGFIAEMIDQHERAADLLRAHLENREVPAGNGSKVLAARQANSAVEKPLADRRGGGTSGRKSDRNTVTVKR